MVEGGEVFFDMQAVPVVIVRVVDSDVAVVIESEWGMVETSLISWPWAYKLSQLNDNKNESTNIRLL